MAKLIYKEIYIYMYVCIYTHIYVITWKYATITLSLKIEAQNVTLNCYHFENIYK